MSLPKGAWGEEGWEIGAGDGTRTHDIQLGKLTLYQLSYARMWGEEDRSEGGALQEGDFFFWGLKDFSSGSS